MSRTIASIVAFSQDIAGYLNTDKTVVLIGDFSCVSRSCDRPNSCLRPHRSIDALNRLVHDCHLVDMAPFDISISGTLTSTVSRVPDWTIFTSLVRSGMPSPIILYSLYFLQIIAWFLYALKNGSHVFCVLLGICGSFLCTPTTRQHFPGESACMPTFSEILSDLTHFVQYGTSLSNRLKIPSLNCPL